MAETLFEDVNIEEELEKAQEEASEEEVKEESSEEKAEEKHEEASEKEGDDKEKRRVVDYNALHQERERRKEEQRRREEVEARYSKLEERINAINESISREREVPYEQDPAAWLRQQVEAQAKTVEGIKANVTEHEERAKAEQFRNQVVNEIVSSENAFRQKAADYDDAVNFLRQGRADEYRAMGFTEPSQIEQMLVQEAFQIARQAQQAGLSPAEVAYNIARARGYKGAKPVEKENAEKMEMIQKGQERNKSLSGAGGEEQPTLDAETLANMTDEEFAAAMNKGAWNKVLAKT